MTGALAIVAALRLREEIEGVWVLALNGVLSVLLGLGLIVAPGVWTLAVVWLIDASAITSGVLRIALASRLRGRSRSMRTTEV